jgi:hypothetical protein
MLDSDKKRFAEIYTKTAENYAKSFNPTSIDIQFAFLKEYSIKDIEQAYLKHIKQCEYFPTVAHIIKLIPQAKKQVHISADEAWTIAKASWNQELAVVITDEILQAADIAYDANSEKDESAARMAFRSAYSRIVADAPEPKWFVSQGNDKTKTESIVQKAVDQGRLPQGYAHQYRIEAPTTTVKALIEGYVEHCGKSIAKEELGKIRKLLDMPDFVKEPDYIHETPEMHNAKIAAMEERRQKIVNAGLAKMFEEKEFGIYTDQSVFTLPESVLPE